jgi:hypothetical protein
MPTLLTAPTGEAMFAEAIGLTLRARPLERADLFERLTGEIEALTTAPDCGLRPWTRSVYTGTDGSRIFRGSEGSSLVIDPGGKLWRARSYEDFATTYTITPTSCEIASLTPLYSEMREYVPRAS